MASHKKKKHQTRLTFEPAGSSDSPGQASSAKVRYAKGASTTSSPSPSSPSRQTVHTPGPSNKMQTKLRSSTGRPQTAASPTRPHAASFMPGRHSSRRPPAGSDSSDEEENEDEDDMPLKSSQSVSTRLSRTILSDEDDEEDDEDDEDEASVGLPSTEKRRRPPVITLDDDDDNNDDDDEPIIVPGSSKRSRPKFVELEDSSDGVTSPMKKRKTSLKTPGRLKRPVQIASSSPTKRGRSKPHRSEKQKKLELLRRRRAGEMIDKVTSSEEDSDGERRGIYDSDSDQELLVLKEFDDEEPDEEEVKAPTRQPPGKKKQTKLQESDDELDDFVIHDDDAPIGAPANLDIPLEFTAQAHRPLKQQFPYVIEWLVHNRINPAFERKDPVYTNAWRKLDDEVRTLASSKFASSAWKSEFYRALKGRPKMDAYEMDRSERDSGLHDTCEACGRRSHPATFKIFFRGHPYYKDTLAEVESDSSDSDSDSGDNGGGESGRGSVDSQGMALPPETRAWHVGVVCCGNAETAHGLIHWKHALKEWVEDHLEQDGWMDAKKLKERESMKARKRRDLANKITDGWREKNIIASLYRDFKNTLEEARNKTTTGRNRGRFH